MTDCTCKLPLGINCILPDHSLTALLSVAVIVLSEPHAFCGYKGNIWCCFPTQEKSHFEGRFSEWLVTTIRPNTWLVLPSNSSSALQETSTKESTITGFDLGITDWKLMAFVKWYEHNGLHWVLITMRLWTRDLGLFFRILSMVSNVPLGKPSLFSGTALTPHCTKHGMILRCLQRPACWWTSSYCICLRSLDANCYFSAK